MDWLSSGKFILIVNAGDTCECVFSSNHQHEQTDFTFCRSICVTFKTCIILDHHWSQMRSIRCYYLHFTTGKPKTQHHLLKVTEQVVGPDHLTCSSLYCFCLTARYIPPRPHRFPNSISLRACQIFFFKWMKCSPSFSVINVISQPPLCRALWTKMQKK